MPDPRTDPLARAIRTAAGRVAPITLDEVLARPRLDVPDLPARDDQTDDGDRAAEETHGTGGTHMVIELEERRVDESGVVEVRPRRPGWAVAAAAAAVLVLVGIGVGVLTDVGDGDRVDVAPAEDVDPTPSTVDTSPESVLDRFITAVNDRDEDTMYEFLDSGWVNGHLVEPGYLAVGDRWTRTGPCQPSGTEEFVCLVRRQDDFHGAAGLVLDLQVAMAVGDDGMLAKLMGRGDDPYRAYVDFRHAFREWVEANHPDAGIRFYPSEPEGSADTADLPEQASAPAVLDLVDDFVAQSEDYPVG